MPQKEPLISVIVPIYQIDKYIGICIESILNQTYKNLEIILVDDGSKDRCAEICDLYSKKDKRIRVIHKDNGGLVSARKAGLEVSTGKYVGYVDGDDWIDTDFYEKLYAAIQSSDSDVVCAGFSRDLFTQSECFLNSYPAGIYEGDSLKDLQQRMISNGSFYRPGITTYVWNKLFKREFLYQHQMNVDDSISIGEDAAVTYPVLMECKRVCVSECVSYHYRQREDSMLKTITKFEEEAQRLVHLYEYLSYFAKKYDSKYQLQKQIEEYVLGICIMRSGGKIPENKGVYDPFGNSYHENKVVVYSAGTFGQQLMNRLKDGHCKAVGWVDDDYWEYRRCCLDVDSVDSIVEKSFDFVLIATVDCRVAEKIKKRLLDYQIPESKLLTIQYSEESRKELIEQYLY